MQTIDLSTTQARIANRNELAIAYSSNQLGDLRVSESNNIFFRSNEGNSVENGLVLDSSFPPITNVSSDTFSFEITNTSTGTRATVIAEGILSINNGGNFAGNLSNLNDDAFLYAGKGFNINGSNISLPLVRDQNGNLVLLDGRPSLIENAISVAGDYSVFNSPKEIDGATISPQVVSKKTVEVPLYQDILNQQLSLNVPTGSQSIAFNASANPINTASDWSQFFPQGGTTDKPTIVKVSGWGLNIPNDVKIENAVIIVENGDVNFNGASHQLNNVAIIALQGSVNLGNVQASDLTVLAANSINMNQSAVFSGETLLANGSTNGIVFSGAASTATDKDFLKIISQGQITYNATSTVRGELKSVGDISFNANADLVGSIYSKGNVFFNGFASVKAIAETTPAPIDLTSAENLGNLLGSKIINDFVGISDSVDFFKFNVDSLSNFTLKLDSLIADADVGLIQDLNLNNKIDFDELVTLSNFEGTTPENIDVILSKGEYFVIVEAYGGDTNYRLNLSLSQVTEFPEQATIKLVNSSETAFNQTGGALGFQLSGINSPQLPTLRIYSNGQLLPNNLIQTVSDNVVIPSLLKEGRNDIQVYGIKDNSFSLIDALTLWAGDETIEVTVVDENSNPVTGAVVNARLGDNQDVLAQVVTNSNGKAIFQNIPNRTILFDALGVGNSFDSIGSTGNVGQVLLQLKGINQPSPINNNDFSLGLEGWNIGNAPVQLVPNQESSSVFGLRSTFAVSAAAAPDIDLVLNTSGEGEESISRTFTTEPGTKCITLRYKFVTTEIPGGFFGTQFNDYFSVSIRSLKGGGTVFESNSMNGLGLSAFDASGATQFREITIPVNEEGDTIQVDIGVANVADGLFDSQVVIDSIESKDMDMGYENVDIEFKGFIPSPAVSLLASRVKVPERGIATSILSDIFGLLEPIFGGDNRGFGDGGSSRFTQNVTVTADPDKSATVGSPTRTWGQTTKYSPDQGNPVAGQPFWWWAIKPGETPLAAATLPVTNGNNNVTVERISDDTVKVNLKISGGNPLAIPFVTPNLDADVNVFIRQKSPCDAPEYKLEGATDGFPGYELVINGKRVYGTRPDVIGTSPFNLGGSMDLTVSQGWQRVPQ
ncbi:hypothetical protein CAL7716_059280 [Calothrix sp. PCC 7716]|nr:hypothetical protein CAL7716_059280 [Calothrix sp. PCC 7716]